MKVIDVLNKIANGEEVRFRALCDGNIYELTDGSSLYNETQNKETGNCYITNEKGTKCYLTKHSRIIANKVNEIIDYLNKEHE